MASKNEEYMLLSKINCHLHSKTSYIKQQPALRFFLKFSFFYSYIFQKFLGFATKNLLTLTDRGGGAY